MKINLKLGGKDKNGYLNIDGLKGMELRNLDEYVDDAECIEVLAEDILDYLQINEARSVLAHWISKLRHGGKLIVGGTDIAEVCRMFYKRAIDLESLNEILHGNFQEAWSVKLSHTTMEELASFLESQGIKVTKKRIEGFKMIVEGERP